MTSPESLLNLNELRRYLGRIGDRWPLERAVLGGARVADARDREGAGGVGLDELLAGADRGLWGLAVGHAAETLAFALEPDATSTFLGSASGA